MARPRKNTDGPTAKERIHQAFWDNLQEHKLHSITVSMIVKSAGCNRGTFYYHYEDINDLLNDIVNQELVISLIAQRFTIVLHTGSTNPESFFTSFDHETTKQIALLEKQGGSALIDQALRETVFKIWKAIFYDQELSKDTTKILEYLVGGIGGLIRSCIKDLDQDENIAEAFPSLEFVQNNMAFIIESISNAQKVSSSEVKMRLLALVRYINQNEAKRTSSMFEIPEIQKRKP